MPTARLLLLPILLCTLLAAGCGQRGVDQVLLGAWEGHPDSLAAKRERNPIPTEPGYRAPVKQEDTSEAAKLSAAKLAAMQPSETTDLESFNFTVLLEFKPQNQVVMRLNGGQEIAGSWKVLSTDVGVSQIELVNGIPSADPEAEQPDLTKRRYMLELDKSNNAFTLREEGVDPRFGWLYFQRVQ